VNLPPAWGIDGHRDERYRVGAVRTWRAGGPR
jgi:hypothetical protein